MLSSVSRSHSAGHSEHHHMRFLEEPKLPYKETPLEHAWWSHRSEAWHQQVRSRTVQRSSQKAPSFSQQWYCIPLAACLWGGGERESGVGGGGGVITDRSYTCMFLFVGHKPHAQLSTLTVVQLLNMSGRYTTLKFDTALPSINAKWYNHQAIQDSTAYTMKTTPLCR